MQPVEPVQGKNFQKMLEVDYTANVQTNQGTDQLYGGWVTFYNASTGMSGFWISTPRPKPCSKRRCRMPRK